MASQFQNRLVGISILVASVVIFLPTIIDGKKTAYQDEFVATPIHPGIKPHTHNVLDIPPEEVVNMDELAVVQTQVSDNDEQWQVEEIATTVTTDTKTPATIVAIATPEKAVVEKIVAQPKAVNKTAVKPRVKKKKLPDTAWTIQLGAFQNAANINALLKTLHKAGFQAHTIPKSVIDGELTRVFVGPDVSKAKLKKQLPRLKRLTKLEGKLYPFDAVNP